MAPEMIMALFIMQTTLRRKESMKMGNPMEPTSCIMRMETGSSACAQTEHGMGQRYRWRRRVDIGV